MSDDMPGRDRNSDISAISERRFLASLPSDWVATEPKEDVGVDFDIEVFEGKRATGIHFYVQLKGSDHAGDSVQIKSTTLNYWKSLDLPTLVVLHSADDDSLRLRWSHLLELTTNPGAKERTIHLTDVWTQSTPAEILREVRGLRSTRRPGSNLPILIGVREPAEPLDPTMAAVRGGIRRLATTHPHLTTAEAKATPLRFDVMLEGNKIDLRLVGLPFVHLSFDLPDGAADPDAVALIVGDISLSMGLQLARIGLADIGAQLIVRAVPMCSRIWDPDVAAEAAVVLARTSHFTELEQLMRRVYVDQDSESGLFAIVALQHNISLLPLEFRRRLADAIADAAQMKQDRGVAVYNAAGLLRRDQFDRARELYEQAASLLPDYRRRGYWWSEQASTFFHQENFAEADKYYSRALELGYEHARPLLADTKLRTGEYRTALQLFAETNNDATISDPQWRLTEYAFSYLIQFFGLESQNRDPSRAERLIETSDMATKDGVLSVLEADLLSWFPLWAASTIERSENRPTLPFVLAAALLQLRMPVLWEESLRMSWAEAPHLTLDIISCIKHHCREDFLAHLDEDDFLDEGRKRHIEKLIADSPEPADPQFTLRDPDGFDIADKSD